MVYGVFCQRARLYRFDSNAKEWQERDVGEMKILHHVEYDSFEILLRGEEGHRVVCDMLLTADMDFEPLQTSDRAWIWAGLNHYDGQGNLEKLAAKFKNAELASQFKECIDMAQQALRERPRTKQEKENISDSIDPIKIDSNMFEKRAILFAQNDETWTKLGMGYVKMFYDSNIFGARIIMKIHNTDEIISSTIISIDTSIQILDKECMWKAFDCALNPPERRLLNAVFSSHQDAKQMFMSFKDIQHYAKEAIRNQLGS